MFDIVKNEEFIDFAYNTRTLDTENRPPKPEKIPMMTARRLSIGCRMAVDVGSLLLEQHPDIDAVIYSSRSGEIEHNFKILDAVTSDKECSPTDFSMSVHNCGVGNFTILNKAKIPSTSVSSGTDTFMQALTEAYVMLNSTYKKVLLVDYEVTIPEFYTSYLREYTPNFPHAVGLILTKGDGLNICTTKDKPSYISSKYSQSVEFLINYVKNTKEYSIDGKSFKWKITRRDSK